MKKTERAFTLIETLVAISLLSIAIVAPMSLTAQSLATAYYARDQITAFHLAQEAIESVRHARDHNILQNALGTQADLLAGIPSTTGSPFTVDTRTDNMVLCPSSICPPLQMDPNPAQSGFYGYDPSWVNTRFTRTVKAVFVGASTDEVRVSVTVSWQTGSYQTRSFTISENLYRWVSDGSGSN